MANIKMSNIRSARSGVVAELIYSILLFNSKLTGTKT